MPGESDGFLSDFFQDVFRVFWFRSQDTEEFAECRGVPRTEQGTIKRAIMQARGIHYGDLADDVRRIEKAFPELSANIWTSDVYIVARGEGIRREWHRAEQATSARTVNCFLLSDAVREQLRQTFPDQMRAMEEEQQRRQDVAQ